MTTLNNKQTVILIGLPGLDQKILKTLIKKGALPNLARLNLRRLNQPFPCDLNYSWSSIASGAAAAKQSIFGDQRRNFSGYKLDPELQFKSEFFQSSLKQTPKTCFWNLLNTNSIPYSINFWPHLFPTPGADSISYADLDPNDLGSFYSSDPLDWEEQRGDQHHQETLRLIQLEDGSFNHILKPPTFIANTKPRGLKPIHLDLKVNQDKLFLEIADRVITVSLGQWSQQIKVEFKTSFFTNLRLSFNCFLISTKPFLKFYLTPLTPTYQSFQSGYCNSAKTLQFLQQLSQTHQRSLSAETQAVALNMLPLAAFYNKILAHDAELEQLFWHTCNNFNSGFLSFNFNHTESIHHLFWNNLGEETIAPEIEQFYIGKDQLIGKILERFSEQSKILIVSSHGTEDFRKKVNLNNWLMDNGYLKLADKSTTILDADWKKSSAYALGPNQIYINVRGRDPQGCVEARHRDLIAQEIATKLKELKFGFDHPIAKIYISKSLFNAEVNLQNAPDLIIGFQKGYSSSPRSSIGILDQQIVSTNNSAQKGSSTFDSQQIPGTLLTNLKINTADLELIDLAPTILKIFNLTAPPTFSGKSVI